ncbi:MAG: NADPH-dependent 7-cyano-7-deazaguanine reductase QueF [Thermomonas sp.]
MAANKHSPAPSPEQSLLGREAAYPRHFDAALLYPISRALGREGFGFDGAELPFVGLDRWHAYELSWLDARGKPQVATATLQVPADSPNLIESKSLKLYLNSCNATRFASPEHFRAQIQADLSVAAGAPVALAFGLPPFDAPAVFSIDGLDIDIAGYGPPDSSLLAADPGDIVEENLHSALLKSNCPVTGQPDWADVFIAYRGPRIDHASLLHYLVSFRDHAGFHEQCVERIFTDISALCLPDWLSVEARYTRRGGLDINPWRATPGATPPVAGRCTRQ